MSLQFKLIIPLLDEQITKKDISPTAGFVDAYSEDINRPYLDNHIFLLYASSVLTNESFETEKKLSSSKNLYGKYKIYIGNTYFILFAFTIINKSIKSIMNNACALSDNDKMRIFAFWNLTDADVNRYMLNPLYVMYSKFVNNVIPEEDYKPKFKVYWDKKSGTLQYRSAPL